MVLLRCQCGAVVPVPVPSHCPQCGSRIRGIRRRANWGAPLLVLLIFATLATVLILGLQ